MVSNKYLNTNIQKAFMDSIPECTEHHIKLLTAIREAHRRHKSLTVCWLDFANGYGNVNHNLIAFSLKHYHAPPQFCNMLEPLYSGLKGSIVSQQWTTNSFNIGKGVFQGDPLSVLLFNTVMNTYIDAIANNYQDHGYQVSSSDRKINLLQYVDDTSLLADGPLSCHQLLKATEQWLSWSGMTAKISKCCSLAIKASSSTAYNPNLTLGGEPIHW